MRIDEHNSRHLTAGEGKVLQRISDNVIFGKEVWLGYAYYLGGKLLAEPLWELPEHYREIDEEDVDDRPVELPDPDPDEEEEEMPDTITMGDLRKMRKQVEALTTVSSSVINTFALPLPLLFPYRNYTLNGRIKLVRTSRKGSGSGMTEYSTR